MKYREFAEACERISQVTKRLEIRSFLSEFLRKLDPEDIPPALYMLQGQLRPEYEGVELGVGDALVLKALATAAHMDEGRLKEEVRASGDMGESAFKVLSGRQVLEEGRPLELSETYDTLRKIGSTTGEGSQEGKTGAIAILLTRTSPVEAKHLVRFLLGKLRLGVKEMTLLDALAEIYGEGDFKLARGTIENAFNMDPDLGEIGTLLREAGLKGLEAVTVALGKPVRPMLAERERSLQEVLDRMGGKMALEYKYDGLRVQVHVDRDGNVKIFSRRLEDLSSQFPDVVAALKGAFRTLPVIVEGECVPVDPETGELRPFQEISRRRGRKYDLERIATEIPVEVFLFDLLLEGTESLLPKPYPERRERLEKLTRTSSAVDFATREIVSELPEAERFFQKALTDGCEGVVAKSLAPDSRYKAGGRGFLWIKYKREYTQELSDTIDAVIVGAYRGRGKRAQWYGAFLMALYDPDRECFSTLCKVGTGFDEETLASLTQRLTNAALTARPPSVESGFAPDVWVDPEIVLELRGAELSLSPVHTAATGLIREGYGLALRFPRFTGRLRDDKGAEEATTVGEAVRMYTSQVRHVEEPPKP